MDYVKLTNRTNRTLCGTWDGRQYSIPPGSHEFSAIQARKFKEQNPVMGSEDPYTLRKEYLLGVEAWGDDVSPLEAIPTARELVDRSKLPKSDQSVEVINRGGLYAHETRSPLQIHPTVSVNFEEPLSE